MPSPFFTSKSIYSRGPCPHAGANTQSLHANVGPGHRRFGQVIVYCDPVVLMLLTAFPPRRPGFDPRSGHMRLMVNKVALGQVFSPNTSVSLPILIPSTAPHSSTLIRGWYNWPISGRRTKWTQLTPRNY
jgi:hypothetical protein